VVAMLMVCLTDRYRRRRCCGGGGGGGVNEQRCGIRGMRVTIFPMAKADDNRYMSRLCNTKR
jgi:hypothetical protein